MLMFVLEPLLLTFGLSVFSYLIAAPLWLGILVGGAVWSALVAWRLFQLIDWVKHADAIDHPKLPHLWGHLVAKFRRVRREMQQQMRTSDQRLNGFLSAIQASPTGVMLLDEHFCIEWCNATAASQLGIEMPRDMMQIVNNLVRDPIFLSYLSQTEWVNEVQINGLQTVAGKSVIVSIRLHAYDAGRYLMLTRDVTQVQQAEAMRRDFVANVSHEIRTPLTVLSGFVETMQALPLSDDERNRYLNLMAKQASRMQTLVADLLTLSRLEGSPMPSKTQWMPLVNMLEPCMADAKALSMVLLEAHQAHQFELMQVQPLLDVAVNSSELTSAISNLLSNAVRYTPAGQRIVLGARVLPSAELEIFVQDTGHGIPAEHIARLTERFYRVDRSRSRDTGGTGLGLAIVKHIVQRHGGSLLIESTLGQGSMFTLRLPVDRIRLSKTAASLEAACAG
jgi:two-component system, OmpR family, phosphate regulon sensor histidine kinase PhoR